MDVNRFKDILDKVAMLRAVNPYIVDKRAVSGPYIKRAIENTALMMQKGLNPKTSKELTHQISNIGHRLYNRAKPLVYQGGNKALLSPKEINRFRGVFGGAYNTVGWGRKYGGEIPYPNWPAFERLWNRSSYHSMPMSSLPEMIKGPNFF